MGREAFQDVECQRTLEPYSVVGGWGHHSPMQTPESGYTYTAWVPITLFQTWGIFPAVMNFVGNIVLGAQDNVFENNSAPFKKARIVLKGKKHRLVSIRDFSEMKIKRRLLLSIKSQVWREK